LDSFGSFFAGFPRNPPRLEIIRPEIIDALEVAQEPESRPWDCLFLTWRLAMTRSLLGAVVLLISACSGIAQTVDMNTTPGFYVVLNSLTKTCTVVDKTPRTDTPNITVASDTIYKTRAEAEAAVRTLTPCNR
jgi:hypothetical protein